MKLAWLSRSLVGLVLGSIVCTAYLAYGITEEVALGSVTGTAVMKENGKPLPKAEVVLVPKADTAELTKTRVVRTDAEGHFRFKNLPAGFYTLEASGKAHNVDGLTIQVVEGKSVDKPLSLKPRDPYLDLYASLKVFTPNEHPTVKLTGFGPGDGMKLKIYRIDTGKVVAQGGLQKLFSAFARAKNANGIDPASVAAETKDLDQKISTRDVEGVFMELPQLPQLAEGFYWVQATIGDITRGTYFNVSHIGLITKTSGTQLISYVADLETGSPVAGSRIQFYRDGKPQSEANTGADGTASLTMPPVAKVATDGEEEGDTPAGNGIAVATLNGSSAVVDFGMTHTAPDSAKHIFMYSDRPVYRPGDDVQFKGIIRTLKGSDYVLPGGGKAEVEIHDSGDTLVERQTLNVDSRGLFSGHFSTNKESDPGQFTVKVKALGSEDSLSVNFADYRKPEFTIKVVPDRKDYVVGDHIKATIQCEYYFGGPVVGAKVNAMVSRSPAFDYENEEGDSESYGMGSGEDSKSFDVVTDASGKAVIEFDAKQSSDPTDVPNDWIYHVQASVSEDTHYFDGSGDIRVNQGAYGLQVRNETGFVEPGNPVAVMLTTRAHGTKETVGGRKVHLVVGTQEWNDDIEVFKPEQTLDAVTDENGSVTVNLTPKAEGSYLIKGASMDDAGHNIEAEDSLYVEGGAYYVGGREQSFEVTLDKHKYTVGGTAKALIRSSKTGLSALVTVEADHVMWSKVVQLDKVTTVVEIPVTLEDSPNAQIVVTGIKEKHYLEAQTRLLIDDERRALKIQITPDKARHLPGDSATYKVHTTDPSGKATPADVSVAVVDESIYAIQEDTTNPMDSFYPKRGNSVSTNYSFPEIYLDGGDKGGHIAIRRKFRDTAFWSPNVRTDANGDATVTVKLPDNLTQWRTTCVGVSDDTRVGLGKCDLQAAKPLMVRLEVPAFVTVGDKLEFSAIVQNDTGKDADVHLRIDSTGVDVDGGEKMQTLHVPSGKPQQVQWTLSAAKVGDSKLTARAWIDNAESDGVEQVLTVNPAGLIVQERKAGIAKGSGKLTVNVSPEADKDFGRLVVNVSPTIAQAMFQSLDELIDFPYGCTEQTMSRFMPAVLVQRALKGAASPRPDLTKNIPRIAAESIARLKKMQHSDGGWGWWQYDTSDPYLTAYVLDGLHRAADAGYPVSPFVIERANKWVNKYLATAPVEPEKGEPKEYAAYRIAQDKRARIYLGYATAVNGNAAEGKKTLALYDPAKSDAGVTAYAALLYKASGNAAGAEAAVKRLKGLAKMEVDMASWSEKRFYWSDTEPTGLALTAIAEIAPKDPIVEMAVHYLMRSRKGDWWYTTRDTAVALVGLSDYLRETNELAAPQTVEVFVNGKSVKQIAFDVKSVINPETRVTIPMNALQSGDNVVEVRNGGGVTYFGAGLRQAVSPQGSKVIGNDSGLTLERDIYRFEAHAKEDGTQRLMPSVKPVTEVKSGDVLECSVTITTDRPREFVMVEVPIPANVRVTDLEDPYADGQWSNWWAGTVIRDDRVAFFIRNLPAGKQELTFTMRAEANGSAIAGPVTAANMYDPAQASHSVNLPFVVNR